MNLTEKKFITDRIYKLEQQIYDCKTRIRSLQRQLNILEGGEKDE